MYWIVDNIGGKHGMVHKTQFHALKGFSDNSIRKLLEHGAIREIASPPISAIPTLKEYAILLNEHGLFTVMDMLDNQNELDVMLNISVSQAKELTAIAETILRPDIPLGGG